MLLLIACYTSTFTPVAFFAAYIHRLLFASQYVLYGSLFLLLTTCDSKFFHSCYSIFASCCWVFLSCYSTVATQDDSSIIIAYCWLFPAHGSALRFASFYVIINVSLPVVSYFERVHEKHSVGTLWPRRNHNNNEKAPKVRWVEGAGEANTQQCDTVLERSCTKKQCLYFLVLCGTDESTAN